MKSGSNLSTSLFLHSVSVFSVPILLILDVVLFTNVDLITYIPLFVSPIFISAVVASLLPTDRAAMYPKWLYTLNVIFGLIFVGLLAPLLGLWLALNQGIANLAPSVHTDTFPSTELLLALGILVGASIYLNIIHTKRIARQSKTA
ncbi:MAG TPA: hypothetical protein VGE34_00265 [Candidatus Saccharimonadales bacterium]